MTARVLPPDLAALYVARRPNVCIKCGNVVDVYAHAGGTLVFCKDCVGVLAVDVKLHQLALNRQRRGTLDK